MKKLLLCTISSFVFLSSFIFPMSASAAVTCQPIYGGGQTCVQVGPITLNKMVSHPKTGTFVENLGINDDKFAPDQLVNFQLTITNTGQTTLSKVTVRDILPPDVSFLSGSGSFDVNTRTISFDLLNLVAGESRSFTITAKVAASSQLPADKVIVCDVNQANATTEGQTSSDNAQFCIEKPSVGAPFVPTPTAVPGVPPTTKGGLKVFPPPSVTITPPTGPEALALAALIPTGILGQFLRRKSIRG